MKFVPRINLRFNQLLDRTATPPAQRQSAGEAVLSSQSPGHWLCLGTTWPYRGDAHAA